MSLKQIHIELDELIARTTNAAANARRAVLSQPNLEMERNDGTCEALLFGSNGYDKNPGDVCGLPAGMRNNGRSLCWVHNHARLNGKRNQPLEYVRRGPDLEGLLERSIRLAGGTVP